MGYAELHCHSNYSFQEGASSVEELLVRAKELGYPALALTDHDNLCGVMHFAEVARSIDIQPITGAEVTLSDGSVWKLVNAGEISKVLVWTPTTEIVVQELEEGLYEIANTSTNETITVRRRG